VSGFQPLDVPAPVLPPGLIALGWLVPGFQPSARGFGGRVSPPFV